MPGTDPARAGAERPARPHRVRDMVGQWPLIAVLVLLWCAVWEDYSLHVALAGLAFSLLVMVLFPMPRIPFSGRLNPWWFLVFTAQFLGDVVRSSVEVSKVVLLRGRAARSSIVGVRLRSHDDLVITLVSHALALVPGSIVLDVDRARSILYLHVLDATTDEDIAKLIEVLGSRTGEVNSAGFDVTAGPLGEAGVLRADPVELEAIRRRDAQLAVLVVEDDEGFDPRAILLRRQLEFQLGGTGLPKIFHTSLVDT